LGQFEDVRHTIMVMSCHLQVCQALDIAPLLLLLLLLVLLLLLL
jgi:hypothetical protein